MGVRAWLARLQCVSVLSWTEKQFCSQTAILQYLWGILDAFFSTALLFPVFIPGIQSCSLTKILWIISANNNEVIDNNEPRTGLLPSRFDERRQETLKQNLLQRENLFVHVAVTGLRRLELQLVMPEGEHIFTVMQRQKTMGHWISLDTKVIQCLMRFSKENATWSDTLLWSCMCYWQGESKSSNWCR